LLSQFFADNRLYCLLDGFGGQAISLE